MEILIILAIINKSEKNKDKINQYYVNNITNQFRHIKIN